MSAANRLSMALALSSMALVALLLLYAQRSGLSAARGTVFEVAGLALSVGAMVGIGHALWMGRYVTELRRLIHHLETLGPGQNLAVTYQPRLGTEELAEAIDVHVSAIRHQNQQLICQRRELEVRVRLSETERQHAQAILNAISDAVIVTDAFNEIIMSNGAAARLFQFRPEEVARWPIERAVGDPALVKMVRDIREAADVSLRRTCEHCMTCDGRPHTFSVTVTGIAQLQPQVGSELAGVVLILHDITREKEIAEMKSDFVSNVSHELKTPLSSIKAYLEMLIDGEADDEQTRDEFYNIIQGETNRLQRLIENILNISRIESGVVRVQREHVALPMLAKEAIDVMQPQARARQIELVDSGSPLFFQIFADKDMIYQAILNLLGNAIKYTPAGGKVTLAMSVDEHEGMVNVSVTDTGVGVPKEDLPYLFDKFYRVNDHKKMAKGTGLGLNLVKHIVETVHGGRVSVSSTIGKGSTFAFSLPLADRAVGAMR